MPMGTWELVRVAGWATLFLYFVLEFLETETGWRPLPSRTEKELRYFVGATGTFLILLGYVMVRI